MGPAISTGVILFEGYTIEEAQKLYQETIGRSQAVECSKIIFRKKEKEPELPLFDKKETFA